jgi:hypothetical protein
MKNRRRIRANARQVERIQRYDRVPADLKKGFKQPGSLNPHKGK